MLKQHHHAMLALMALADAVAVACAWLVSYWLRFELLPVDPAKGVPELADKFLPMLPLVVAAHLIIFYRIGLYRPRRSEWLISETRDVLKAFVVAIVVVVLIDYALPASNKISRRFVLTYAVVGSLLFAAFRATIRVILHALRRRGFNQRLAAIVGSGRNAQKLQHALERNAWTGLHVAYFVDDPPVGPAGNGESRTWCGRPIHGPISSLREIVERHPVDAVFIALPTEKSHRTNDAVHALETSMADVRLVPEIEPAYTLRAHVGALDDLPILSLRQTPLYGANALIKRAFDIVVGLVCLLIAAIPMLIIAIAVKLSSPGPVLYRQRRMGLDGHEFDMLKFRSMRVDSEARTGAVWATPNDPRRTPIGAFLRRTSLDELPQLFNVLRGDMSLVGPRPERPEFIAKFKDEIPRYMLRHKMKAGMTGYAQINGLRGSGTSLKKRIQHDVHYIRSWSIWLDVRILLRTVFGVWFSKHEM
jgi:Undecaprenyl-phosphate glucose phosphotransferase